MSVLDKLGQILKIREKQTADSSQEDGQEEIMPDYLPDPYDESQRGKIRRRSVFTYNFRTKRWETAEGKLATETIELTDVLAVFSYSGASKRKYLIWCPHHGRYETPLLLLKNNELTTAEGCHFTGHVCLVQRETAAHYNQYKGEMVINLRWTISTVPGNACCVQICREYLKADRYKEGFRASSINRQYLSFDFDKKTVYKQNNENQKPGKPYECWQHQILSGLKSSRIPQIVVRQFFHILQHDYPQMPSINIQSIEPEFIKAYLYRPWDPAIVYLYPFLSDCYSGNVYDYLEEDKAFAADSRDNFYTVAEMLNLPPTHGLHRAYARYPYYLPVFMALKKIGFDSEQVISGFNSWSELRLIYELLDITYDREQREVKLYPPMAFLIRRLLFAYGEKGAARRLHAMMANLRKTGSPKGWGTWLHAFSKLYHDFPQWVREKVLSEGPSYSACQCIHAAEMCFILTGKHHCSSPKELGMQARCGAYDIRLPRTETEYEIANKMERKDARWRNNVTIISYPSYVVVHHDTNELAAAIRLIGDAFERYSVVRVFGTGNGVPKDARLACRKWIEENNISTDSKYSETDLLLFPWETARYARLPELQPL